MCVDCIVGPTRVTHKMTYVCDFEMLVQLSTLNTELFLLPRLFNRHLVGIWVSCTRLTNVSWSYILIYRFIQSSVKLLLILFQCLISRLRELLVNQMAHVDSHAPRFSLLIDIFRFSPEKDSSLCLGGIFCCFPTGTNVFKLYANDKWE